MIELILKVIFLLPPYMAVGTFYLIKEKLKMRKESTEETTERLYKELVDLQEEESKGSKFWGELRLAAKESIKISIQKQLGGKLP